MVEYVVSWLACVGVFVWNLANDVSMLFDFLKWSVVGLVEWTVRRFWTLWRTRFILSVRLGTLLLFFVADAPGFVIMITADALLSSEEVVRLARKTDETAVLRNLS
jgi:hypothetical protein